MIRVMLLSALLLTACATKPAPLVPADLQQCAPSVAIPAPAPRVRTPAQIGQLEIRVELAREAERSRGDDCADRLARLNAWIGAR
jgi:hypothetical protein